MLNHALRPLARAGNGSCVAKLKVEVISISGLRRMMLKQLVMWENNYLSKHCLHVQPSTIDQNHVWWGRINCYTSLSTMDWMGMGQYQPIEKNLCIPTNLMFTKKFHGAMTHRWHVEHEDSPCPCPARGNGHWQLPGISRSHARCTYATRAGHWTIDEPWLGKLCLEFQLPMILGVSHPGGHRRCLRPLMSQMGLLQQSVRHRSTVASCVQPQLTSWGSEIIAYWTPEFSGAKSWGWAVRIKNPVFDLCEMWKLIYGHFLRDGDDSMKIQRPQKRVQRSHSCVSSGAETAACMGAPGPYAWLPMHWCTRPVSPWENVALHGWWIQGQLGLLVHWIIAYQLHWPIETLGGFLK